LDSPASTKTVAIFIYLLLSTIAELRAMVMDKLLKNAANAEQLIVGLKQRLASLQAAIEQQRKDREKLEIAKLINENASLQSHIEKLKYDLECTRIQNGVKAIPLPKKVPTPSLPIPAKAAPIKSSNKEQKEQVREAESAKRTGKAEAAKENRKANEKDKVGKKKESASNEKDAGRPIDASRLDMRVGKIIHVERHPDANSLFVEKVNIGEEKPRTIVSGLVGHVALEELQDRMAIFMCNLKPVKMRGIFSEGMIMCATGPDQVNPLIPPEGSVIGDRVRLQGYTEEPDALLNPKKKIWEQIKPDMHVNADGIATYKGREFYIDGKGSCTSPNVRNCPIT